MGEEFIREINFEENVIQQHEPGMFLLGNDSEVERFQELLQAKAYPTANESEMIQVVVVAALEAAGLELDHPELIAEAVMANPEMHAEAIAYFETILAKDVH